MAKIRRIIVSIAAIIYLVLFIMKVDISSNVFLVLTSIVMINQVIEEWNDYKETKKKVHLLIPITFLISIIFLGVYLLLR